MTTKQTKNGKQLTHARERRKQTTQSEGLLWSVLRARQLCNLKFRREHPIGGFITDFASEGKKLVVEIDGGYHDQTVEEDVARERILRDLGWDVIRFSDKDVEEDAEAVCRAIAMHLGLEYSFKKRRGGRSGMKSERPGVGLNSERTDGPSPLVPRDPPKGG